MNCQICNKEFTDALELTSHLVKEHQYNIENIYSYYKYNFDTREANCPACNSFFTMTSRQVKNHSRGASKAIGCCAKCSRKILEMVYGNPSTWEDVKQKKLQTSREKYGVDNVFQLESVKQKSKRTMKKLYGADHPLKLKEFRDKQEQTNIERYGVKHVSQLESVKRKKEQTALEHFGVKNVSQSEEIKAKKKKASQEKYGTDYTLQAQEVRDKGKETFMKKYGVEYSFQAEEIKEKSKETNIKKYGTPYAAQSEVVQEKIKNTNKEKYGVERVLQADEVKKKIKRTNIRKYGVPVAIASSEIKERIRKSIEDTYGVTNVSKIPEVKKKKEETVMEHFGVKYPLQSPEILKKVERTNLEKYGVKYACLSPHCIGVGYRRISKINRKFQELLKENNIESELEFILDGRGYDLKVNNGPLIEINPWFTHNTTIAPYFAEKGETIDSTYHLYKTKLAKENGYSCIHIFDWDDQRKIIDSLKSKEHIFARKCELKKITNREAKEFLNTFHLQGSIKTQKFSVGLYYNDTLVEVMTFGKPRYNKNYEWELLRLCSHSSFKITGGASKLLTYFEEQIKPKSLLSYCDISKFNGEVYEKLGFTLLNQTEQAKNWYNPKTKRHITDNLLRQRGFDQLHGTSFSKGTSNEQLMIDHGYVEVYDCGQLVFVKEYSN